jgi:hypothetical protein
VLSLSADLRLPAQTPETDAYPRALVPSEQDAPPIPAGACNVAAQVLALEERDRRAHPPVARVHPSGGRWLTLRAARIADPPCARHSTIAVTSEQASSRSG